MKIKKRRHTLQCDASLRCRRRPTLPRPLGRSTIGAVGLNDRVRDGNGCGPYAPVASESTVLRFSVEQFAAYLGRAMRPEAGREPTTENRSTAFKGSDGQRMVIRGNWLDEARCAESRRCHAQFCGVGLLGSSQATRAIRTAALGVGCPTSTGGLSTGWSLPAL